MDVVLVGVGALDPEFDDLDGLVGVTVVVTIWVLDGAFVFDVVVVG